MNIDMCEMCRPDTHALANTLRVKMNARIR